MPTKNIEEMIWPVEHYNDKIKAAIKARFKQTPWLSYDEEQMKVSVKCGYDWLNNCTDKQNSTLGVIIRCVCKSLIYQGLIVKIKNKLSTKQTWQWRDGAIDPDSNATIISSEDSIAKTEKAKEYFRVHGPVSNGRKLTDLLK